MDNATPLTQNIAASGGIVPLCVAFLMFSPSETSGWLRVSMNLLAAAVSLLICYVTAGFVLDKRAGHRWLHSLAFIYFGLRATVHVWVAFDWWFGIPHVPLLMVSLSNGAEIIFGMYYYVTRRDLSTTYKRSEVMRQQNIRRLENIGQAAMNLEWISEGQDRKSRELTELIKNVGRGT